MDTLSTFKNISSFSSFKSAFGLSSADIIALGALITAFFSFVITVIQAQITRRHNKLSVRPHIGIRTTTSIESPINIKIKNNGVGPAFINSVELRIDNFKYDFCGNSDVTTLCNKIDETITDCEHIHYSKFNPPVVLDVGQEQLLIEFPTSIGNEELRDKIIKLLKKVQIQAEYRCLYKTKYSTKKFLLS